MHKHASIGLKYQEQPIWSIPISILNRNKFLHIPKLSIHFRHVFPIKLNLIQCPGMGAREKHELNLFLRMSCSSIDTYDLAYQFNMQIMFTFVYCNYRCTPHGRTHTHTHIHLVLVLSIPLIFTLDTPRLSPWVCARFCVCACAKCMWVTPQTSSKIKYEALTMPHHWAAVALIRLNNERPLPREFSLSSLMRFK